MTAYIIKSTISLLLMFGLYWFLLRKEKLFVFNRFFLVISVVFSLVLPFISVPVNFRIAPRLNEIIPAYNNVITGVVVADNTFPGDANISQPYTEKETTAISFVTFLIILYVSGVMLFLIRFLRNIYLIMKRSRLSEKITSKGYQIVLINDKTGPCCFLNNIFLNRDDYLTGRIDKELFRHELEHVRQSHTIDIILIEAVKIFYWFNPVHLLYERAIRINHEYLADNGVIKDNSDIKSYTDKLLSFISCSDMSLTSGSNNSFTKLRLMMMMNSGSGNIINGARISITLCIGTLIFLLLSFKESGKQSSSYDLSETGTELTQNIVRGTVMTKDGMPLFAATVTAAGTNNDSSKVSTDFDGHFTFTDLQAGVSLLIDYRGFKEQTLKADFSSDMLIRLVRDPDYKGRIFIPEIKNVNFRNSDFTPAKALLVIDGIVIDNKGDLRVNPGEIKSFKVLTGKEATKKYGEKGKDGIAEIVLYGNKTGSAGKKSSGRVSSDTSKYNTRIIVDHKSIKGELIDVPITNLQYISMWTYRDIDRVNKKELRAIDIMTRDFFKVKGTVVNKNGKPLSGVSVSATDNPVKEISDKDGRFVIEDVRDNTMLEFSLPGYETYYLATSGAVFTMDLTIELEKENGTEKNEILEKPEKLSFATPKGEPLIIVDGVVFTKKLNDIPAGTVQNFKTLSVYQANKKYGEKGKYGAVEIITKK